MQRLTIFAEKTIVIIAGAFAGVLSGRPSDPWAGNGSVVAGGTRGFSEKGVERALGVAQERSQGEIRNTKSQTNSNSEIQKGARPGHSRGAAEGNPAALEHVVDPRYLDGRVFRTGDVL